MNDLEKEQICREIEARIVINSDLIQLLLGNMDNDDEEENNMRIIHSSLTTILEQQNEILNKFSLLCSHL